MSQVFIDTNILVYAYDADSGNKHSRARELLRNCWEEETGVLSTQVLQEFYVTTTRKLPKPLALKSARDIIATYRAWTVYQPSIEDVLTASELSEKQQLSFWDALIVIAAQLSGASTLYSEDLQHGQHIGSVKIVNPFK